MEDEAPTAVGGGQEQHEKNDSSIKCTWKIDRTSNMHVVCRRWQVFSLSTLFPLYGYGRLITLRLESIPYLDFPRYILPLFYKVWCMFIVLHIFLILEPKASKMCGDIWRHPLSAISYSWKKSQALPDALSWSAER